MTPAIRCERLGRDFGSVRALSELDLVIPSGSIFGFLGPNGAGKTTTIRLLLGLLEPSEGRREVLGLDVASHGDEIRRRTGVLLEHHGLYERLTVRQNLDFFAQAYALPPAPARRRALELLERFGLADRETALAGSLSKGMKQKLAIARALLHGPELLMLDEPTSGLDPEASSELRNDLVALAKERNVTVFLTSHNLGEVERICDRVAVIRKGRLQAVGEISEILSGAGGSRVRFVGSGLGADLASRVEARADVAAVVRSSSDGGADTLEVDLGPDGSTPDLVAFLVEAGARLEEVRPVETTLETAYFNLGGSDR